MAWSVSVSCVFVSKFLSALLSLYAIPPTLTLSDLQLTFLYVHRLRIRPPFLPPTLNVCYARPSDKSTTFSCPLMPPSAPLHPTDPRVSEHAYHHLVCVASG